jgi:putative multiple sugar transport system permease protein
MIIALIVVIIFFSVTTDGKILYAQNINNLFSQNAYVFILATGMLCTILTGGNIDLSVGSVVCFTGGIGAVMMDKGINGFIAFFVMILVGLLIGMFQGFWVAYVSVPPFIVTLAGMYAFRGLSNVVLNGYSIGVRDEMFLKVFGGGADCYIPNFLGGGKLNMTCMVAGVIIAALMVVLNIKTWIARKVKGYSNESMTMEVAKLVIFAALILWISWKLSNYKGIPTVLIWICAILLIYHYITQKTAIGRYLYAVGGNRKATELSGVNTKNVFFLAYSNMGLMAGLAGVLTLARMAQGNPTFGQAYEMDAIAACFIGGASAYGGIGSVPGMVVGAILLGVINQGMSIMGMSTNYQSVVKGLVLLVAVMFDVISKKKE